MGCEWLLVRFSQRILFVLFCVGDEGSVTCRGLAAIECGREDTASLPLFCPRSPCPEDTALLPLVLSAFALGWDEKA